MLDLFGGGIAAPFFFDVGASDLPCRPLYIGNAIRTVDLHQMLIRILQFESSPDPDPSSLRTSDLF